MLNVLWFCLLASHLRLIMDHLNLLQPAVLVVTEDKFILGWNLFMTYRFILI